MSLSYQKLLQQYYKQEKDLVYYLGMKVELQVDVKEAHYV